MNKKYSLTLDDEFIQFCKINNINDIEKFAKETFNKGFLLLKYPTPKKEQKTVVEQEEKKVIVDEKRPKKPSLYDE